MLPGRGVVPERVGGPLTGVALGEQVPPQGITGVALSHQTGDQANLPYHLDAFAAVEGQRGQWQRSAVLLGRRRRPAGDSGCAVYHYYMPDKTIRDRAEADARAALGDAAFGDSFGQGRGLTYQEAVDCVMGTATDTPLQ